MSPENALRVGEKMRAYNEVDAALKGGLSPMFLTATRQRLGCTVEELSLMLQTLQEHRRGELRELGVVFPGDDVDSTSRDQVRDGSVLPDETEISRSGKPDRLTITLTGPQGCGKSLLSDWLRGNLPARVRPLGCTKPIELGPITIIDGIEQS